MSHAFVLHDPFLMILIHIYRWLLRMSITTIISSIWLWKHDSLYPCKWVMPQEMRRMSHVTHMHESCRTQNESCHTFECVMLHIRIRHVSHMSMSCHIYVRESCQSNSYVWSSTKKKLGGKQRGKKELQQGEREKINISCWWCRTWRHDFQTFLTRRTCVYAMREKEIEKEKENEGKERDMTCL